MKILINTFGTRGDIQPYIALAIGLQQAGYTAAICTSEGYRAFVEAHGLRCLHMDNQMLQISQDGLAGNLGIRESIGLFKQVPIAMAQMMADEWQAAQEFQPDLILYHPKCLGSYHIAEKLQIPAVLSLPLPFYTPTREFPVPFMAGLRLGGWANQFSYRVMGLAAGMYYATVNDLRVKILGLPPQKRFADLLVRADGSPVPIIYPYSPHLLPVPADFPPHVHVTGYWFLDQTTGWQPEPELVRFLEAGPAPVYVGFGSMGGIGAQKRASIVLDALEKSGQRGLLTSGWGGLKAADLPPSVLMLESVPHDWLFPRVSTVVHHGGAGTTAAGLRAGKPTVICPFLGDQPFWGRVVHERGVGPEPIPQSRLSAERLAQAITTAVQDEAMQRRAAELGEKISAEDGVACGVEVIGAILKERAPLWK